MGEYKSANEYIRENSVGAILDARPHPLSMVVIDCSLQLKKMSFTEGAETERHEHSPVRKPLPEPLSITRTTASTSDSYTATIANSKVKNW